MSPLTIYFFFHNVWRVNFFSNMHSLTTDQNLATEMLDSPDWSIVSYYLNPVTRVVRKCKHCIIRIRRDIFQIILKVLPWILRLYDLIKTVYTNIHNRYYLRREVKNNSKKKIWRMINTRELILVKFYPKSKEESGPKGYKLIPWRVASFLDKLLGKPLLI